MLGLCCLTAFLLMSHFFWGIKSSLLQVKVIVKSHLILQCGRHPWAMF